MSGQIPPYGKNFKRESLLYHPELASTIYVLKLDEEWFIRSDKTSKRWQVFQGWDRDRAASHGKVQTSMTKAMQLMLDGIAGGFYVLNHGDCPKCAALTYKAHDFTPACPRWKETDWHCDHERQAAKAGTWRTDQDWASHCASGNVGRS